MSTVLLVDIPRRKVSQNPILALERAIGNFAWKKFYHDKASVFVKRDKGIDVSSGLLSVASFIEKGGHAMLSQISLKLAGKKKAQGEVNSEKNKLSHSFNSERYKRHGQEKGSTAAG